MLYLSSYYQKSLKETITAALVERFCDGDFSPDVDYGEIASKHNAAWNKVSAPYWNEDGEEKEPLISMMEDIEIFWEDSGDRGGTNIFGDNQYKRGGIYARHELAGYDLDDVNDCRWEELLGEEYAKAQADLEYATEIIKAICDDLADRFEQAIEQKADMMTNGAIRLAQWDGCGETDDFTFHEGEGWEYTHQHYGGVFITFQTWQTEDRIPLTALTAWGTPPMPEESLLDGMGLPAFPEGSDEDDHAPPTWGGRRDGAGPTRTSLRGLDIADVGIEFDRPVTYTVDGLSVEKCGECGAVGWGPYSVMVQALDRSDEPDDEGFHYHVLANIEMPGHAIKHAKKCKYKG